MNLRKNLFVKITALVVAFGLWAWVNGQDDVIKTMQVPIDLSGLPENLEIVSGPLEQITLRLSGPEIALRSLLPERVRIAVNLADRPLSRGANTIPLVGEQVSVPAGVRVDLMTPNVLELRLEPKATREVPVSPEVRGEPAAGFEIAGTVVQPPRVVIEGPEQAVLDVESFSTPAIPIDGQNSNQTIRVRPIGVGPAGSKVRLADPSATVQVLVRIRPIQMERTLAGVTIDTQGTTADGQVPTLDTATVELEVSGPREVVAQLQPDQIQAILDIAALTTEILEVNAAALDVQPLDPSALLWKDIRYQITSPAIIELTWPENPAD